MIIKKKYLKNLNNEIETQPEDVQPEMLNENEAENIEDENQLRENDIDDFDDLDIENIKFEQREERREGTRRRGYRRTQDRNLITRAQQEAISIKEAARIEGYETGIQNAVKDLETIKSKFTEFYTYKDEVFQKVSECIFDISVEIAKKILQTQVEANQNVLIPIIKEAVADINRTENKITLRVMPKDVELVKDNLPEIFSDNNTEAKIMVIPDNNIKEGGVIVETSNGIVDASLETQLMIIAKALKAGKEGA